jgi:hypothetical protein
MAGRGWSRLTGGALIGGVWVAVWLAAIGAGVWLAALGLNSWWARDEARTNAFAAKAERLGLSFAATDVLHATWEPFRFLGGPDPEVRNVAYGTWRGVDVRAFEFSRRHESGIEDGARFSPRERFSCAVAAVDASCPRLVVGAPADVGRMAGSVHGAEIVLESADFQRRFRVASADSRFAVALLDQRMMAWLLEHGERFTFEVHEDRVLCVGAATGPEGLPSLVEAIAGFHDHVPRVVHSLYPRRPMDGPGGDRQAHVPGR